MAGELMRTKPSAQPLRPDELALFRQYLKKGDPRPDMSSSEVAARLGLTARTVVDLCGHADGFPNAWRLHNRVRVPAADVEAFRKRRRLAP